MKFKEGLLYLLIFLLPTQLGKHFFLPFSYISGLRIDYLSPTLFLTDCIIFCLIFLSLNQFKINPSKKIFLFIFLIILNVIFSLSPFISIYKWLRIAELISVFILFRTKLNTRHILFTLIASSFIQLVLVIYQITQQHSLQGIAYLLGERYFTISTPGIAKITLQGVELLRGYGTFSHPNSLGGFFLLLYTYVLFEKKFSKELIYKYIFLGICTLLIFLSFSKVAIITFILINSFFVTRHLSCKFCAVGRIIVISVLSVIFLSAQGDPDSFEKRIYLIQNALSTLTRYPLFGTGLGAYLVAQTEFSIPYSYLFFQPVHNIFLLSLAEMGVGLFSFIIYFGFKIIKKYAYSEIALTLLCVICFTGLFDHYWFTLQQNMLVIPVVFGLLKQQKQG